MKKARKQTKLVITDIIIDIAKIKELSLNEFLVLTYLDNDYSDNFEIEVMSKSLKMNMDDCLTAFNSLMMKGLVSLESKKDGNDKFREVVSLDGMYKLYSLETVESDKKESNNDIFNTFEVELGRTLSPNELEILNGWLETGSKEEIIIGALREAIYNGTPYFRYIDRIIYEWEKNNLNSMEEVNDYLKNRRTNRVQNDKTQEKKEQEFLDYDWLNND